MNKSTDIDIVVRYLEDPENEQLKAELNDWIEQDNANLDIFLDMKAMWQGDPLPAASSTYDVHGQWEQLDQQLVAPAAKPTPVVQMKRRYWWAAAAVLLLAAGTWTFFWPGGYQTFATNQQRDSIRLSDGSMLYLNSNTRVRYAREFGKNSRTIKIDKGEAFFDVTKQDNVPFIVNTPEVAIQVLGTSFNVKSSNHNVKVFVESGKVSATYKVTGKQVILTPGMEASLNSQQNDIDTKTYNKRNNILAWKTRTLIFDETPLSEVAASLADFYHVQVKISNPQLADKKLLATFPDLSLDEVLDIMRKTLRINITKTNDLVEIY
jgi:ferric-dicitrate binding protein FerR (iron transport regulator)